MFEFCITVLLCSVFFLLCAMTNRRREALSRNVFLYIRLVCISTRIFIRLTIALNAVILVHFYNNDELRKTCREAMKGKWNHRWALRALGMGPLWGLFMMIETDICSLNCCCFCALLNCVGKNGSFMLHVVCFALSFSFCHCSWCRLCKTS